MDGKNKKEQLIIKACCAVAAFILWLYIFNIENPIKEINITVPVKVVNQELLSESKLAPVIEGDINLTITISGNVTEIYSVKPEDFELQADLNALALKKGDNKIPVTVNKSPAGINVVNADNLWVKINVDDLVEKTVPVKVLLVGKAKEGFYALNPELKYNEAKISGPSKIVNLVKYAIASCDINGANKDVSFSTPLMAESETGTTYKYVVMDPAVMDINVPVKKVKTVGVNVKLSGNLDASSLIKSILPANNKIEIAGDDEYLNSITAIDTEPVDISNLKGAQSVEAKLVVPKGVTVVNNISSVKLNVTYNNIIQKDFTMPVKAKNVSSGLSASMTSSSVSVTVSGTEALINNLKSEDMECFIDLSNMAAGTYDLPVNVTLPAGISKISVNPPNISVTLK